MKKIFYIIVGGLVALLFISLVTTGITTHDDYGTVVDAHLSERIDFAGYRYHLGRGGDIITGYLHYILGRMQTLSSSLWMYRTYTTCAVMVSCYAWAVLMKQLSDKQSGWLSLIIFFVFLQFGTEHDGLYSFGAPYQLHACYAFFSLVFFLRWLHSRGRKYLVISAILYLVACLVYEAFVPYGILFAIMDIGYMAEKDGVKVRIVQLIKDLWLHAGLAILYVIYYFYSRRFAVVEFEGTDAGVSMALTPAAIWGTTWRLAVGMFPLRYNLYSPMELLQKCTELSVLNIVSWLALIPVAYVLYHLIKDAGQIPVIRYVFITIGCGVGALLPGFPCALTDKFVNWIYYSGIKSFGVSYYAYFFIVAWLAVTAVFLYQRLPLKKVILVALVGVIVLVAKCTVINNDTYIRALHKNEQKAEAFAHVVETDYFATLPDESIIYMPDFIGIHYKMQPLIDYANHMAGTNVTMVNTEDELDFSKPVYVLRYDYDLYTIEIAPLGADGTITGDSFVYQEGDGLFETFGKKAKSK